MDIRKVKKLIELMEESDIAEIEIKEGEDAVRITRASHSLAPLAPPTVETNPAARQAPAANEAAANEAAANEAAANEAAAKPSTGGHVIRAPMVGTFYRAPSPSSPPFVDVGTRVKAGDTVCIIESMKMMNQVKADKSGVIEAVLADNGSPVEFDQLLFTIAST